MDLNSLMSSNFMPNGGLEKKGPENSITSDPSSPLQSDERIQSRYLKSHMPSCHDFCKYGKKHDFGTDATSANFRKFLKKKKNLARTGEQNQVTILVPRETRIKTSMKTKAETEFLDKFVVPKSRSPTPLKRGIASVEKNILQASLVNEQSRLTSLEATVTNKPDDMKLRESSINKEKTKPSMKKPVSYAAAKVIEKHVSPLAIEPQNIKKKDHLPPRKVDVAGQPAIALKTKTPLIRSVSQLNFSPSLIARRNQERKITRSLGTYKTGESKLLKTTTTSISSRSSGNLIHRRNKDNMTGKNLATSKISERIVLKSTPIHAYTKTPPENVSSFHRIKLRRSIRRISSPLENISSVKARRLVNVKENLIAHENVASLQAKKLGRVKWSSSLKDDVGKYHQPDTRSVSENIDSDPNTKCAEAELATSEVSDEDTDEEIESDPQGDEKKRERTASSRLEENTSTPFKLKFRRGKVVNLRSDSIRARRLWFGRGTLGGENPNGDGSALERRNSSVKAHLDFITPNSEAQTVVLKHQDVTEKKDAQSLFNHVIEETASKLVETRKSKVKALVGAFETVISLQ